MSEWQDISTAPKDGREVELTWMDNGRPQERFFMQWGHIKQNGLFPGKVGMWMTPDGALTWNDDGDGGPTHWRMPSAYADPGPTITTAHTAKPATGE